MSKTIFLLAGFMHDASESQFDWLEKTWKTKGFIVQKPKIGWKRRVMSDYVDTFIEFYKRHKTEQNYVLGFSFGAMIAFISASRLRPDRLFLCSLSPYFYEDFRAWKPSLKLGTRRYADLQQYKAKEIASSLTMPTTVFYGSAEAKQYPQLQKRCQETAKLMPHVDLLVAQDAPHQIDHPGYIAAITSNF